MNETGGFTDYLAEECGKVDIITEMQKKSPLYPESAGKTEKKDAVLLEEENEGEIWMEEMLMYENCLKEYTVNKSMKQELISSFMEGVEQKMILRM